MNPYEILEVEVTADKPKIKKAYRKKAQKYHPDKGGDIQTFQLISLAYETLIDDDKRSHFDQTDSVEPTNFEKLINSLITQAFETTDRPVYEMKKTLKTQINIFQQQIDVIQKSITAIEKRLVSFLANNTKANSTPRIKTITLTIIEAKKNQLQEYTNQLAACIKAQEYIKDFNSEPEPKQSSWGTTTITTNYSSSQADLNQFIQAHTKNCNQ